MTVLHAGGKFGGDGYKVSGGLHGVGISVVNALSESLIAEVHRDGGVVRAALRAAAIPLGPIERVGDAADTGTTHHLPARPGHLRGAGLRLRDARAAPARDGLPHPRASIVRLDDRRGEGREVEYHYEGGIQDFVRHLNETRDPVQRDVVYLEADGPEGSLEVALQWTAAYNESVYTFANNINTHEGGTHLTGFRTALTRTLNDYARAKGLLKEKDDNLEGPDTREGLTAIVSIKLREPQFEGQTKTKLGNSEITGFVNADRHAAALRVPRGAPGRGPRDLRQGDQRRPGAAGRPQGARPGPPQGRHGLHQPAGQARRLLRPRSGQHRALPGGGRLGRGLGDHGAPVELPGDPAPARQDHQRREGPDRQGPLEQRDPGHDHRDGHRHRRGLRPREGPLPQAHHHDRRRRGRRPHPHAHPHVPLPPHARRSSRRASSTSRARRSTRSSRATRSSTSRRSWSSRTGCWSATWATSCWRTPRGAP